MSIKSFLATTIIPLSFAFLGAFVGVSLFEYSESRPQNHLKNYYRGEMATVVSPQTIKKYIDEKKSDYILVDLRSQGEYEKEHFITAINIPAGSMDEAQLVASFERLPKDKTVIVHCYSSYCTLGRQVGEALANHGIYVKELTVGWSELRYHWDLWNPGAGVDDGKDYIVTGKADPSNTPIIPCTVGAFGC